MLKSSRKQREGLSTVCRAVSPAVCLMLDMMRERGVDWQLSLNTYQDIEGSSKLYEVGFNLYGMVITQQSKKQ